MIDQYKTMQLHHGLGKVPFSVGRLHFIGIGGIGMSGIAEVLATMGYQVSGSDLSENQNVERLVKQGIDVKIGHDPAWVEGAAVIVVSSAVKQDNVELQAARRLRIPIAQRADMLVELMRFKRSIAIAGSHGKTTLTSLVYHILSHAGYDPTLINGGILNAQGTNARFGKGEWLVAEADESDGSFTRLLADIGVVTNIDPEHLDHYGTFESLLEAFQHFIEKIPFYGFAAVCLDHENIRELMARITDRRLVTYGFSPQAQVRVLDRRPVPEGQRFTLVLDESVSGTGETTQHDIMLSLHGAHNVANALGAITVAHGIGVEMEAIVSALKDFQGVNRRFTQTGFVNGVRIIDDYGHHPVEISAVLSTAREVCPAGRILAVMEPHRYSRLQDLFTDFCGCFHEADQVLIAPVYAAGESPIADIDHHALVKGIAARGHGHVEALDNPAQLAEHVHSLSAPGDIIVCLGAGGITKWAQALPGQLEALSGQ